MAQLMVAPNGTKVIVGLAGAAEGLSLCSGYYAVLELGQVVSLGTALIKVLTGSCRKA